MDHEPSEHAGLTALSVPIEGVAYVLSGWSGQGSLFQALGAVNDPEGINRDWNEKSIRRRAGRILLEHVRADLQTWPQSLDGWLPHLRIASTAKTLVSQVPHGRVDWRETSRRFGWPARSYVTRLRERKIADVTVSTLAWTVAALDRIVAAARKSGALDASEAAIDVPLAAAREALALTDVPDDIPRPDRHDLESLRTSGRPWSEVEPVTANIVRSETDLNWFALQLLAPDPDFGWRLYHLAVLGHALMALRAEGAAIRWRAPMGAGASGPNFVAAMPDGTKVDIWFEAAGAREYYGFGLAAYRQVVGPVRGSDSAIGSDVALYIPDRGHALLLECKFSWSGSYIGRNGYHQAAGYALNEQDAWARLWSYVIGPEEKVAGQSRVDISGRGSTISLGVTAVPWLSALIKEFLDVTA
ncbi:hypothetical protein NY588_14380 [Curtobacterium flaccumfaciens pv. beticola]|uniref:hypothetical protein n=1 Tax=Curtobacterium flaccumfaciens TaxID=2035 RepID=UPI00349F81BB|nr:hypothetical protein [Curtobacterium flaccumfaciens pv. basellae]